MGCDYLITYLICILCYFMQYNYQYVCCSPLYLRAFFSWICNWNCGKVFGGKMLRCLMWKDAPWEYHWLACVSQCRGMPFPNSQLLVRSDFSFSKHNKYYKRINIIQTLCQSADRHCSKSGGPSSKSGHHLLAPHESRHPMLCLFLAGPLLLSPEWAWQPQLSLTKSQMGLNLGSVPGL